jgi:hypothetical protein
MVLGKEHEAWRNSSMESFTSTPVYKDGKLYATIKRGELVCLNADSGEENWMLKLAPDQVHASPTWADGKLYVPMFNGKFYVIADRGNRGEILSELDLGSACLAAPSVAHGRVFVQAKRKLFCFGSDSPAPAFVAQDSLTKPGEGAISSLQVVPAEFALRAGQSQVFTVFTLDKAGNRIEQIKEGMTWGKWIPPVAKVKSKVDAHISDNGVLTAERDAELSAGALRIKYGDFYGVARGRILQNLPYEESFEYNFELNNKGSGDIEFSYPPLSWLGARMRWQVQLAGDNHVAGNTLDRVLFQRAINFIGHQDMRDYTMEADVMTDGDRRIKSNIGLINQRYIFVLVGNSQKLEVVSNFDRFRHSVPFAIKTKSWYRLKTKVNVLEDGTGLIQAKAWPSEEEEPDEWTLEVSHSMPHLQGSPGLYAMSPQSKKKVYIDNIKIFQNR